MRCVGISVYQHAKTGMFGTDRDLAGIVVGLDGYGVALPHEWSVKGMRRVYGKIAVIRCIL